MANNRKLTQREMKRKEEFEKQKEVLLSKGYKEKDLTISVVRANVLALVIALPIIILYFSVISTGVFGDNSYSFDLIPILLFLALLIASTILHEGIHGLTWSHFADGGWKAIEFGIIREMLTPYCTCKVPLKKSQFIIGALMPTLTIGVLPMIVGLFIGSLFLFQLGGIMIIAGGGDILIVMKLILHKEKGNDNIYIDHPSECGLVVFER